MDLSKYEPKIEREDLMEEILDNYLGSWAYATKDQLIDELSMVYLEGLTGLRRMSYNELEHQLADYKEK